MSTTGFRHVVALLYDGEREACEVLDRAVGIASSDRARLTLAKTSDPGRVLRWVGPLTATGAYVCSADAPPIASRRLAKLVDRVPASVPSCHVVMALDTAGSVRKLLAHSRCDLVVVPERRLACDRRLKRVLRACDACILTVPLDASDSTMPSPQSRRFLPNWVDPPGLRNRSPARTWCRR